MQIVRTPADAGVRTWWGVVEKILRGECVIAEDLTTEQPRVKRDEQRELLPTPSPTRRHRITRAKVEGFVPHAKSVSHDPNPPED